MNRQNIERPTGTEEKTASSPSQVVEVPLLLTGEQADCLEAAARRLGLTPGDLLGRLCRDFLRRTTSYRPHQ